MKASRRGFLKLLAAAPAAPAIAAALPAADPCAGQLNLAKAVPELFDGAEFVVKVFSSRDNMLGWMSEQGGFISSAIPAAAEATAGDLRPRVVTLAVEGRSVFLDR